MTAITMQVVEVVQHLVELLTLVMVLEVLEAEVQVKTVLQSMQFLELPIQAVVVVHMVTKTEQAVVHLEQVALV